MMYLIQTGTWTEQDVCDFEDNVDERRRFRIRGNKVWVKYRKENK